MKNYLHTLEAETAYGIICVEQPVVAVDFQSAVDNARLQGDAVISLMRKLHPTAVWVKESMNEV